MERVSTDTNKHRVILPNSSLIGGCKLYKFYIHNAHIPLGKMNTFLLTCLYLSFTYVHASLKRPLLGRPYKPFPTVTESGIPFTVTASTSTRSLPAHLYSYSKRQLQYRESSQQPAL